MVFSFYTHGSTPWFHCITLQNCSILSYHLPSGKVTQPCVTVTVMSCHSPDNLHLPAHPPQARASPTKGKTQFQKLSGVRHHYRATPVPPSKKPQPSSCIQANAGTEQPQSTITESCNPAEPHNHCCQHQESWGQALQGCLCRKNAHLRAQRAPAQLQNSPATVLPHPCQFTLKFWALQPLWPWFPYRACQIGTQVINCSAMFSFYFILFSIISSVAQRRMGSSCFLHVGTTPYFNLLQTTPFALSYVTLQSVLVGEDYN